MSPSALLVGFWYRSVAPLGTIIVMIAKAVAVEVVSKVDASGSC